MWQSETILWFFNDWKTYHNLSLYFAVIHTNSYTKQRYILNDDIYNKQQ